MPATCRAGRQLEGSDCRYAWLRLAVVRFGESDIVLDFVSEVLAYGRRFRVLVIVDGFTREWPGRCRGWTR
jgi:hypothetical protein